VAYSRQRSTPSLNSPRRRGSHAIPVRICPSTLAGGVLINTIATPAAATIRSKDATEYPYGFGHSTARKPAAAAAVNLSGIGRSVKSHFKLAANRSGGGSCDVVARTVVGVIASYPFTRFTGALPAKKSMTCCAAH